MTTPRNPFVRFADNNMGALTTNNVTYSSQLSTFPFSNAINSFRSKVWKPSGYFLITASSNDTLYINDGSNKTITLTASTTAYTTGAILAAHIQTQLNASSSNWTCTYSLTTNKFTIGNSGSVTLRLSVTTNSVWSTIGFTTSSNIVGTSFVADQQRNHTSEFAQFDLGYQASVTFFAVIAPLDLVFPISTTATVKLMGNNIPVWTSPIYSKTLTRLDGGFFLFMDDTTDTAFRFWKFEYNDIENPLGSQGISIGHIYLGDYSTFTNRNFEYGFSKSITDPSIATVSEAGAIYFDRKTKFSSLGGLTLPILKRENKDYLETLFQAKGKTTPFYISLDPLGNYTNSLDEITKYVFFKSEPKFQHVQRDMFSTVLDLEEAI